MNLDQIPRGLLMLFPFLVGILIGTATPALSSVVGIGVTPTATITSSPTTSPSATSTETPTHTPTQTPTATPLATDTPRPTATNVMSTATPRLDTTPTVPPGATPRAQTTNGTVTRVPAEPTRTASGQSVLDDDSTMLAIYGRGFGIAPILGMLGGYRDFDAMDRDLRSRFVPAIQAQNGGKRVIPTIHLIYALAIPCSAGGDCLLYLEAMDIDIVKEYIEPAARRGWHIILDSQLGRSDPVTQVQRMIDRGYLKYDHVHVALDPEFKVYPGRTTPGIPIGQIDAAQINRAQDLLAAHSRAEGLRRSKMLMVHQFGDPEVDDGVPHMVLNKKTLRTVAGVDLVLDADGFGGPDPKVAKYNLMLNPEPYPFIRYRAIKLFFPNAQAPNHYDKPLMEWAAVFGRAATPGGYRIKWAPNVVVIA
ncbi:MAG: hypothetical protein FJ033_11520 [Chloroflexi bacterium]|nr:hypothetical protein [Chloroflexota bacterium]